MKRPWEEINWEEQWALFAKNFKEGKAHIPVGEKTLLLLPGPGFGDLSHPTTVLMMKMMQKYVAGESIIDIGTGSGILALSALLLKARSAVGIDLDPSALKHARKNGKLNKLKATFSKSFPKRVPRQNILLMNMIFPEQKILGPDQFNRFAKLWIVSGILAVQKEAYLAQATRWHWRPVAQYKRGEWLGFIFSIKDY